MSNWTVVWIDAGREPQYPPDPAYPQGIDLDLSNGAFVTCTQKLPYPARRCGQYLITCKTCGLRTMVTTAGRPDDPRSLKLRCKLVKPGH
jgi:hypothetical protein